MKNHDIKQSGAKESKELALHYMATLADVAREPLLILSSDLRVLSANQIFYRSFQVLPTQTENKFVYELGNGQWNIPAFKSLLEGILPKKKVVKDYEVRHIFPIIGDRIILLNARQVDSAQLIILAMEDITVRKELEKQLAEYTKGLEKNVAERTRELADRINELESSNKIMVGRELKMMELKKEIDDLKKRLKNGNGKNGNGKNREGENGRYAAGRAGNSNHKNGRQK